MHPNHRCRQFGDLDVNHKCLTTLRVVAFGPRNEARVRHVDSWLVQKSDVDVAMRLLEDGVVVVQTVFLQFLNQCFDVVEWGHFDECHELGIQQREPLGLSFRFLRTCRDTDRLARQGEACKVPNGHLHDGVVEFGHDAPFGCVGWHLSTFCVKFCMAVKIAAGVSSGRALSRV